MKKKTIVSVLLLMFVTTLTFSQSFENWKFVREIGPVIMGGHGVTVTPDGCIWVGVYYGNEDWGIPNGAIVVLDPNGDWKEMITDVSWQGVDYTFSAARGISTDCDGNVLYSSYDVIYKIDYQTYECLGRTVPIQDVAITTAVSDFLGNIVVGFVTRESGLGYLAYTSEFDPLGTVIAKADVVNSYTRDITMSFDGRDLYLGCNSGTSIAKYYSADGVYGSYTFDRYIGQYGISTETVQLDDKGRLWVGSQILRKYDCWDVERNEIVGGFSSVEGATNSSDGAFTMVRGIAFSLDGKKAYTCEFAEAGIQEWEFVGGEISTEEPKALPEGFTLLQNYPNPFNPSTNFSYSVPNKSDVRIAVYDMFGREIKTLVNENKAAGEYSITWNGRDNHNRQVATGVYFYKMQAAGFEKTMKMMLMK